MAGSQYLGAIHIWQKLNQHRYYLTSTTSLIFQIHANCSPFQSLNVLPFHIRLECLKLIFYSLISIFSKYNVTLKLAHLSPFLSSLIFTALEFDKNYFSILLWEIVKSRDLNEIKPSIGKIFRKYRAPLHETRSELKPVWNLKSLWNVVPLTWQFTWRFRCGNFSNNGKTYCTCANDIFELMQTQLI